MNTPRHIYYFHLCLSSPCHTHNEGRWTITQTLINIGTVKWQLKQRPKSPKELFIGDWGEMVGGGDKPLGLAMSGTKTMKWAERGTPRSLAKIRTVTIRRIPFSLLRPGSTHHAHTYTRGVSVDVGERRLPNIVFIILHRMTMEESKNRLIRSYALHD